MTIKDCLIEYLEIKGNVPGTDISVFTAAAPGRGKVTVEHTEGQEKVEIIHETHDRRCDFYEATDAKELKDVLEFCLGPLISDKQWNQSSVTSDELLDDDYEDTDY